MMQCFLFQDIQYDDIMAREMAYSMETNIIQLCTTKTMNGGKIFQSNFTWLIISTFYSNITSTYSDNSYSFTALSWMLTQETLE